MRFRILVACLTLIMGISVGQEAEKDPVPALIEQLSAPDFETREKATEALIELGETAIEALEVATASEDPEVSWRAESALAAIREKQQTPQVIEGLTLGGPAGAFRVEMRVAAAGGGMRVEAVDGAIQRFRLENGAWVEENTIDGRPYQVTAPSDILRAHLGLESGQGLAFGADNADLPRFGLAPFDVVLELDGAPVAAFDDLKALLSAEAGATFKLAVIRRGERLELDVVQPLQPAQTVPRSDD